MPEKFSIPCTFCHKAYQVEDRLIGRRVKCKNCGEVFILTKPPEKEDVVDLSAYDNVEPTIILPPVLPSAHSAPPPPPPRSPYYPPPPAKRKSGTNWSIGGGAAGGLGVVIYLALRIGLRVWLINHFSNNSPPPDYSYTPPPSIPAPSAPTADPDFERRQKAIEDQNRMLMRTNDNINQAMHHQPVLTMPPPPVFTPPHFFVPPPPTPFHTSFPPAEHHPDRPLPVVNDDPVATDIPAHAWAAEPDPPATQPSINPHIRNVLPMGQVQLYYPKQPSNYVLLHEPGESDHPNTELWNLKTDQRASRFSLGDNLLDPLLSPDGLYFAGRIMGGPGEVSTYQVINARTGKIAQTLTAPPGTQGNVPFPIGFTAAGQLLTVADGIEVWDIHQGARLRQLGQSTKLESADMFAVSATGKLVAWICPRRNSISLYSIDSGKLLGTSALPDPKDRQNEWQDALSAAVFSPDGREIALLIGGKHIYVWSIPDGSLAANFTLADMLTGFDNRIGQRHNTMIWTPDSQGWLVNGDRIVDRATGLVIYNMPDFHESSADERGTRQLADSSHMLLTFESTFSHRTALETLPFDAALIQKNRTAATQPATQPQ